MDLSAHVNETLDKVSGTLSETLGRFQEPFPKPWEVSGTLSETLGDPSRSQVAESETF